MTDLNADSNNNPESDWELQLAEYTMGSMEPGAASEFERGLNECIAHVTMARQYTEVVGVLGFAANAADPPEGHKSRFLAELGSTPQVADEPAVEAAGVFTAPAAEAASPVSQAAPTPAPVVSLPEYREKRRRSFVIPAFATVAAALVIALGVWGLSLQNELNNTKNIQWFPVQAVAPYTSTVALVGVNPASNEATLKVHSGLPALPQAQVYELWLIPVQGAPVPAGIFNADASGKALHITKAPNPLAYYAKVAVSIENPPEKPAPEGPIIMSAAYTVP